jgi:polyribonucleotide 5'-hydroxyl-kinase
VLQLLVKTVLSLTHLPVNILITLGSERLYSDLARKYAHRDPSESVSVIRLDKSGGCVDRSEEYMKSLRHAQVREYFFGHGENTLAPSSQTCDFGELNVFEIGEGTLHINIRLSITIGVK